MSRFEDEKLFLQRGECCGTSLTSRAEAQGAGRRDLDSGFAAPQYRQAHLEDSTHQEHFIRSNIVIKGCIDMHNSMCAFKHLIEKDSILE